MSKACVRIAIFSSFALGCGASTGSGDGNDPFDTGGKGSAGGGKGGIVFPAPEKLGASSGGKDGKGGGADEPKICAQQNFPLDKVPPEIMVVLDRSGSMRRDAQNGRGTPDRWSLTVGALDSVLATNQQSAFWGLKMYPSWKREGDSQCALNGFQVAPALGQHTALMAEIRGNVPTLDNGATPTAKAVVETTTFLKARTTTNPKFILLATDGIPNCRGDSPQQADVPGAVAAVTAAREAGIGVFVVGIATAGVKSNDIDAFSVLNQLAEAGGRANAGNTKFYAANNEAELATALGAIAAQARSCTLALEQAPPASGTVVVEIDDKQLVRETDWEFGVGNRSVEIKGAWCEKLKQEEINKPPVIKYVCPDAVVL